jgi:transposase
MSDEEVGGRLAALPTRFEEPRGEVMLEPEAVAAMVRLKELGWGTKRIARELGANRGTVKRYLAAGSWQPFKSPERKKRLDGLEDWLKERFRRHRGNADVIRQELGGEKGIRVSLRTVERAVAPWRRELEAERRASVRFETAPGRQLQIDFGERLVEIGGVRVKVFLFVATLGYSRRLHVCAFTHERQESWFQGLESAFLAFGGVPEEVLLDNPRALVAAHDAVTRTVVFNAKFFAFARHWGFTPRACAPYRADQGQDGKRRRLRQEERHCRPILRELDGVRGASGGLAARGRERARSRHDRRGADDALRARRGAAAQTDHRPAAVPLVSRPGAHGAQRLRDRGRRQCLFRAVAAHWRARRGHGGRRTGARAARRGRGGRA